MNLKYFFYSLFLSAIITVSACTNSQKSNSSTVIETTQKEKLDTADARLAHDISVFCTLQIKTATLAQTQATTQKVKDFGKQNTEIYSRLNNDLNRISESYKINLPATLSEKDNGNLNQLSAIKGASFDHAYLLEMLKFHNIMIREINAAKNIQCVPLKMFVVRNQGAIIKQAYALSDLKEQTP